VIVVSGKPARIWGRILGKFRYPLNFEAYTLELSQVRRNQSNLRHIDTSQITH
jgi:hypothetical protein